MDLTRDYKQRKLAAENQATGLGGNCRDAEAISTALEKEELRKNE